MIIYLQIADLIYTGYWKNEKNNEDKDKADSENISKEISHRFHEIVGQIEVEEKLDNINLYIQTALSEQKQFVSAIEGKAPKKHTADKLKALYGAEPKYIESIPGVAVGEDTDYVVILITQPKPKTTTE